MKTGEEKEVGLSDLMIQLITTVCVEHPLASPRSANKWDINSPSLLMDAAIKFGWHLVNEDKHSLYSEQETN